jgi:hypothetical protein
LTEEQLREVAEFLEKMSDDDRKKLMDEMREGAAMEDLETLVEAARREAGGEPGNMSNEEMAEALQRLSRMGGKGDKPGDGDGESTDGQQSGQGGQGQADRAGDSSHPGDPDAKDREHVPGQVDPKGDLGQRVDFKGIPKEKESKAEFDGAVKRAASAAEESIGKDRIAPAARPYVRRYFEALKKGEEKK